MAEVIATAFYPQASIIFNSCYAGEGLLKAAAALDLNLSGPDQPDTISRYTVSKKDRLVIDATWMGESSTYLSGQKIK